MEKRNEFDPSAREWFVVCLEAAEGEALRGKVERTADSDRRSFGSGQELLEILRGLAENGAEHEASSRRVALPTGGSAQLDTAPAPAKEDADVQS